MLSKSDEVKDLLAAFAQAQGEFQPIEKNQEVEVKKDGKILYKFKYADLTEIINKTRPALSKHGISYTQNYKKVPDLGMGFVTTLMHSSGQWADSGFIPCEIPAKIHMKDVAGYTTYGKRLSLSEALGVSADEDFDAPSQGGEQVDKKPIEGQQGQAKPAEGKKADQAPSQQAREAVKNEAPVTQDQVKYLFTVAGKKKIKDENLREMCKCFYNIDSTKFLKVWQQQQLVKMMENNTIEQIGQLMVEHQANEHFKKQGQGEKSGDRPTQ